MKPWLLLVCLCLASTAWASEASAPQGSALLKTDIMGVFAHPDDETGVSATLAYYSLGKSSVVANVYCTRGEGGGNMVGTQWGPALGVLREAELRGALAVLGVKHCMFLDQLDWAYTESSAATFDKWGEERTLERLVRLVRALRPEIIITMNPAPTPGQHGHHQAAGVLATEAFSAAADPTRFPLQITKEGLATWQARRLFYAGGGGEPSSTIGVTDPLPNGRTPAKVASEAMAHHRSQGFGGFGDSPFMRRPQRFTLVKTFAPVAGTETNLLAGLPILDSALSRVVLSPAATNVPFEFEFVPRPAFARHSRWSRQQDVERATAKVSGDIPLVSGEANAVQLRILNASGAGLSGDVVVTVPTGWLVEPAVRHAAVAPGTSALIAFKVTPTDGLRLDAELAATFVGANFKAETKMRAHPLPRGVARRIKSPPSLDGTDRGWEKLPRFTISPADIVEGKVSGEADSSATFRLAHDGTTFYVDVEVKDDAVVSNIAPDDIKGHWRSDSVEICLDPAVGAEHTMGCFKLGVFPFDMTGVVRASRDADANQGPIEETAPRTRLASRRTAEGYRIQAAIPFSEIGLARGRKRLGFNLIIYDGDKQTAARGENINKSRIAWAPRSGVQGRPEDWGRIDLE